MANAKEFLVLLKTMRERLNVVLAGVILVLLGIAFFEPRFNGTPIWHVLDLDPNAITRILIYRTEQESVTLLKDNQTWTISEPYHQLPANNFKIQSLLHSLNTTSPIALNVALQELQRYGLQNPRLRLALNDTTISFGDIHPLTGERYIATDKFIYLIKDDVLAILEDDAASFISLNLLPQDADPVAITIKAFTLKKTEQLWALQPALPGYSADDFVSFVQNWQHAQALTVRKYAGGVETEKIYIELDQKPTVTFSVITQDRELILARLDEGVEYHLAPDEAKNLLAVKKNVYTVKESIP